MGAFLGLLFGLGRVAVHRARTVATTPKKPGESWQDRTCELLLQAGIEGVSPGQLLGASVTAGVGAFVIVLAPARCWSSAWPSVASPRSGPSPLVRRRRAELSTTSLAGRSQEP